MRHFVYGAAVVLGLAMPAMAEYPERDIQGIIQWGAGGSTDTVSRSVTPHAEAVLGHQGCPDGRGAEHAQQEEDEAVS